MKCRHQERVSSITGETFISQNAALITIAYISVLEDLLPLYNSSQPSYCGLFKAFPLLITNSAEVPVMVPC